MINKYKNFDWASVGFNFGNWEEEKVWALELPVEEIDIEKLTWHLDIPYWENDSKQRWTVSPRDVIEQSEDTTVEQKRVRDVGLEYPIDIFENDGKLFILDGLHRLAKQYKQKVRKVRVRFIPKERFSEVASEHPFELPNREAD